MLKFAAVCLCFWGQSVTSVQFATITFGGASFGYEALTPAFAVAFEEGKRLYKWDYDWTNYELRNATSYCDQDALYHTLSSVVDLYKKQRTHRERPVVVFYP
ncbi:hypothetical protein RvY_19254, partial [Ramazzottius varieornatus]